MAGPEIARHTRALDVRGGTLRVAVRTSAWAAQLSFLRTDLLAALNRRIGAPGLRALNFFVGETPDPAGAACGDSEAARARRDLGPSPADAAVIDAAASAVSDSDTRRAWRRALTAAVLRRRRLGE